MTYKHKQKKKNQVGIGTRQTQRAMKMSQKEMEKGYRMTKKYV